MRENLYNTYYTTIALSPHPDCLSLLILPSSSFLLSRVFHLFPFSCSLFTPAFSISPLFCSTPLSPFVFLSLVSILSMSLSQSLSFSSLLSQPFPGSLQKKKGERKEAGREREIWHKSQHIYLSCLIVKVRLPNNMC